MDLLWVATLLCLPLISFPLITELTGAIVAPLSGLLVFTLLIIWFLPRLFRRMPLPYETVPLLVFVLVGLVASAAAFFIAMPGFKSKGPLSEELSALLALGLGLAFFLLFATVPQGEAGLKKALLWINIGGIVLLAWSALQAYFLFVRLTEIPSWMQILRESLVVLPPEWATRGRRVTGLAYEASWFTHQLVILYLPLWIASSYTRTSAFNTRLWRFIVEDILVVAGLVLFALSTPRISMLAIFLIFIVLFLKIFARIQRSIAGVLMRRRIAKDPEDHNISGKPEYLFAFLLLCVGFLLIAIAIVLLATWLDPRLRLLHTHPPNREEIRSLLDLNESTILRLSFRFAFGERVTYWLTGWRIFNLYPWFGVGLGNAGFYFRDLLPSTGWSSYEVRDLIYQSQNLPNIKSLWFRLLAETGLVGISTFIGWLYAQWRSARHTLDSLRPVVKLVAFASQLALIAFIAEGFSIDSFAMPYIWVMAGLAACAGMLYRQDLQETN